MMGDGRVNPARGKSFNAAVHPRERTLSQVLLSERGGKGCTHQVKDCVLATSSCSSRDPTSDPEAAVVAATCLGLW